MIISLPMTTNTSDIFSSLLFKWKAERDEKIENKKQELKAFMKPTWWERVTKKEVSEEELFKRFTHHWSGDYHWVMWEVKSYKKEEINQLTSLLAADKLAVLTETTATYDMPDHLIAHLTQELSND